MGLRAVDVGPCGAVDDRLGGVQADRVADRPGVGDVELAVGEADTVEASRCGGGHDIATEHPTGAGDEDHGTRTSELSPSMKR